MATRAYMAKIKAVGGFLLPTSAGSGKVATSDAEGNMTWAAPAAKKLLDVHAWSLYEPSTVELPGFEVELETGQKLFLVAIRYRTASGEAEVDVKRNGAGVTSLTSIKAKPEAKRTTANTGEPVELASGDHFTLNIKSTTAKGLEVTLVLRSEA